MPRALPTFKFFAFARPLAFLVLAVCALSVVAAFSGREAEAEEGLASWYGPGFEGQPTASGEIFDPNAYTAAHQTLPFGTDLMVSYEGRSVPVTVNDRGPFIDGRELDLSWRAASDLGLVPAGVAMVNYEIIPEAVLPGAAPGGVTGPPIEGAAEPAYTVQPGDTLNGIAAELGTTPEYLADTNGIPDPNSIYAGQPISLLELGQGTPADGDVSPAAGYGTVLPGPGYDAGGTTVDPAADDLLVGPQPIPGGIAAPNGP